MSVPASGPQLICRVNSDSAGEVGDLVRGIGKLHLECDLDTGDPKKPIVVAPARAAPKTSRRIATAETSRIGVWVEIWTWNFDQTPYSLLVRSSEDAELQLDLLSQALDHPRDSWTFKPPRGWDKYGRPMPETQ